MSSGATQNIDTLRTERLIGQRVRSDDCRALVRLWSDPTVMATLGGLMPDVEMKTRAFVDRMIQEWDEHGHGLYIVRLPGGTFLGYAGLRYVEVGGTRELEIFYASHPEFWNKGYMTEMATRLRTLALDELCRASVVAFTLATNAASRRVMEKAGLRYERDVEWRSTPHVLYRATCNSGQC